MPSIFLADWQERLAEHFATLRRERDAVEEGLPLFALEHGLDLDQELPVLSECVRRAVAGVGRLPHKAGLPFVVYAAEIGYRYQGDEYWPVFESETEGWKERGYPARLFIRRRYEEFAKAFGGAVPAGPWAAWFKNIAWPITHAILPADLQRHLARLLHDYRSAFTAELLQDHETLGQRLAERSHDTSSRFRKFAENTSLLGLVAASLLLGDDEESPLLQQSVLHRIVVDLSHERQAGVWLRDARRAAVRIRRRGLLPSSKRSSAEPTGSTAGRQERPRLEPTLSLRRGPDGWTAYLALPSHEPVAAQFPDLRDEMARVRCRVAGNERVHPRGSLMYPLGPVALDRMPPPGRSVLSVEDGSDRLGAVLVDHARMRPGPWLFHVGGAGVAREVRTNAVRPGRQYILVSDAPSGDEQPTLPFTTSGADATLLDVPTALDEDAIAAIRKLGLGVTSDLEVWPAGLVAADWDGDGLARWPAGEHPIIGIRTTRSTERCVVSTGEEIAEFNWPRGSTTIFVEMTDLPIGTHEVEVAVLSEGSQPGAHAEGRLRVEILEPADSSLEASARQGLQVRTHPARPTLSDVWTGGAAVVATGPHGVKVRFDLELRMRAGKQLLGRTAFSSRLPVSEERWRSLFKSARGSAGDFTAAFADAEELDLLVSHPDLGSTLLRAERPFEALRWHVGHDRDGPYARLIDHSDAGDLAVEYFDAPRPAEAVAASLDDEGRVRTTNGGLVVARGGGHSAGVVLPPHITGGLEALGRLAVRPSLQTGPRTPHSVQRMIVLGRAWTRQARPGNDHAALIQSRVNDAIVARLGGLIGGDRWWNLEYEVLGGSIPEPHELITRIPGSRGEREIAARLDEAAGQVMISDPASRAEVFGSVVGSGQSVIEPDYALVLLQLASEPGAIPEGDDLADSLIEDVLDSPRLYRLARFFVIAFLARHPQQGTFLEAWRWD